MTIEQDIASIRAGIKAGRFPNEASVSQGIVLRLLNTRSCPTYDTAAVWLEYSFKGSRVSTNHSKHTIGQIINMACDVAQIAYGRDLIAHLGG